MALGDFFSRPSTTADIPIAAMRSLMRPASMPKIASPVPEGRPNISAPPAMRASPPPPLEFPQMRESNEWGTLGKEALGLAKDFTRPIEPDFSKYMRTLDQQIAEMRALRSTPPSNKPQTAPSNESLDDSAGDYVARNASFESGNNPKAVNPGSGASGLFQFLPSTWAGIMQEDPSLGLTTEGILDVDQQKKAMNHYTRKSAGILSDMFGRKPSGGELYLLHLLGHTGGPTVLRDVDSPITETIGTAAYKANPFLKQYKTGRDLLTGLNEKFGS